MSLIIWRNILTNSKFTYIFGEKDDLLLVLLQGELRAQDISTLEQIEAEIKEKPHKIVLFFFRDLSVFIPAVHAPFVKIQKALRDMGKLIGICSLRPEIKLILLQSGIIRESEVFSNIPEGWNKLSLRSNKPTGKI
jgi:anti-anti-sigma regulatory factor